MNLSTAESVAGSTADLAAIRVELQDGLATVTLSQGARGNPFDGAFCAAFKQALLQLWDTPGLRAVLLRADGANFSYGGDLQSLSSAAEQLRALVRSWTADLHMGLQRASQLPVPIVAAVQGFAMGGGMALMAGCDVVLAGESARIGSARRSPGTGPPVGAGSDLGLR